MSTRRKSTVSVPRRAQLEESPALELERLEQETTLVLQEIDHNLSHANAVINDRMIPILRKYASATHQVWTNVGFWKHFLEEAADVEISTADDLLDPPKGSGSAIVAGAATGGSNTLNPTMGGSLSKSATTATPPRPKNVSSSSSDPQIEASTPQLRSRPLLLSSHSELSPQVVTMRKASTGYLKVTVSPRKRTPKVTPKRTPTRADSGSTKRLSVLQNFLNSSPTLPEPPVLLSEVGRMAFASSSSVNRPTSGRDAADLSSDSDDRNLGALLPILFPTVSLTPRRDSRNRDLIHSALSSGQRFPHTPTFGSGRKDSHVSPVRRMPVPLGDFGDDSDLPVPKRTTAVELDESDELPLPELQTIHVTGKKRELVNVPDLSKRRKLSSDDPSTKKASVNDDADNVFLDQNPTRNNSTVYHSVVEEHETRSRSMSQIFEEVLQHSIESDNENENKNQQSNFQFETHTNLRTNDGEKGDENRRADLPASGSDSQPQVSRDELIPPSTEILPNAGVNTHNESQNDSQNLSQSIDYSNSSDLGSFLDQRWKSLSRSLRKN